MDGSVGHIHTHNSAALSVFHDEVESEVLDKENAFVAKSSSKESMEHRVASSVSHSAAAIGLSPGTEVLALPSKGSLVDLSLLGSGEGHSVGFQLQDSIRSFLGHVVDSVLISEPVRALNCVIEVPSPVVLVHVSQGSIDSSLSSNGMGAGREQLGQACGFESSLCEPEGSSQTGSSSAHHNCVIGVVDHCVSSHFGFAMVVSLVLRND